MMLKQTCSAALVLFLACLLSACSSLNHHPNTMEVYSFRLSPGQDLKKELDAFAREKNLQAAFIITCVGSLRKAVIRLADQPEATIREQKFEIVSLVGTLSPDGSHLHISLSDSTGATFGGHLMNGCEIYTTAEIVIGEAKNLQFRRELDPQTTYKELKVYDRKD
jgi:predicted DNA-binding protein with PD1-like motif